MFVFNQHSKATIWLQLLVICKMSCHFSVYLISMKNPDILLQFDKTSYCILESLIHVKSQLSHNSHMKATCKWEDELQGLMLANYCIDKVVSVEKFYTCKKLRDLMGWSKLLPTE